MACLHAVDDGDGVAVAALLEDRNVDGALAVDADDVVLQRAGVLGLADVGDQDRSVANGLQRHLVHGLGVGKLAVGVDVEVLAADAHVARGQDEVGAVHGLDDVVEAEVAGLHLERVDVNLNLAVGAAVGLRDRGALDVGDLIADLELSEIFELRFVEAFAFEGDQADRLRGGVSAQDDRRQRARRQTAEVGHG